MKSKKMRGGDLWFLYIPSRLELFTINLLSLLKRVPKGSTKQHIKLTKSIILAYNKVDNLITINECPAIKLLEI